MSGRHTPGGWLGRRSLRVPLAIGAAAGLLTLAAVAVRAVAIGTGRCSGGIQLTVAAAPEVAPVVEEAAARWVHDKPRVGDECVRVRVNSMQPADVANALAVRSGGQINAAARPVPTPDDADVPAVWIPDSTFWINRMQAINRDTFDTDAPSIATSPVVLAVLEAVARALPGAGQRPLTLAELGAVIGRMRTDPAFRLGVVEPRRDSAGLVGAALLYKLVVATPAQLPNLVAVYRALTLAPDRTALLRGFGTLTMAAPISEQAVLAHNAGSPSVPLVAVPLASPVLLDYPYAILNGKPPGMARAAELFRAVLTGDQHRAEFSKRGFRTPDGTAGDGFPGANGEQVTAGSLTDPAQLTDVLNIWTGAISPSRMLTLVDVTSSMNQLMTTASGATVPRFEVLRRMCVEGLQLFTNNSEIGVWAFATGIGPQGEDYRPSVPLVPLSAGQRGALLAAVSSARTEPTNVSGLYESLLAAYKEVQIGFRPEVSNTVLVFTDGTNSKPGLTLEATLRELERLTDVTKPVRINLIGIGPDIDLKELTEIANTTGGKAFQINQPEEVVSVFLRALLRV